MDCCSSGAILLRTAHDWHFEITKLFFRKLEVETYDTVHLAGMALFKLGVILFFVIPFVALWLLTG